MKRQIKFRGRKLMDCCEWLYGDYNEIGGQHYIFQRNDNNYDGTAFFEVKESTIGQYTGIDDKDGNPIYEDDIIKIGDKVMKVVFRNGCFYTPWGEPYDIKTSYRLGGWDINLLSVIGNIHENSKLLNYTT